MIQGSCQNQKCAAPKTNCFRLHENFVSCEDWQSSSYTQRKPREHKINIEKANSKLNWSGEALNLNELYLTTLRSSPIIIGLVGRAAAGKTCYLGMLFTLLLNGENFNNFTFAGTKTILGWENIAHKMRLKKGNIDFPEPTPSNPDYYSFLHLALRDDLNRLKDIYFTDTSGEVFLQWSRNKEDDDAKSARWIHQNSSAFVLFVDCEALVIRRNAAKTEIIDIAQQLRQDLNNRPVVVAWSKADEIINIRESIRSSLHEDLTKILPNHLEIHVTNFSKSDPDKLCHENNIEVVDTILRELTKSSGVEIDLKTEAKNDFFLNYRG